MWLQCGSHPVTRHPCHYPYGKTSTDVASTSYPLLILRGQESLRHITHENYSFSILNCMFAQDVIILYVHVANPIHSNNATCEPAQSFFSQRHVFVCHIAYSWRSCYELRCHFMFGDLSMGQLVMLPRVIKWSSKCHVDFIRVIDQSLIILVTYDMSIHQWKIGVELQQTSLKECLHVNVNSHYWSHKWWCT